MKMKFTRKEVSIGEFIDKYIPILDRQPIGQRLPVPNNVEKAQGIIQTILDGYDIGDLTIATVNDNPMGFKKESIDGGHRKRGIYDFKLPRSEEGSFATADGLYWHNLTEQQQEDFMNYKLVIVEYSEIDNETKGHIFRNKNKTTDVNFMEMLNSYGNIPIANLVRGLVRKVQGIPGVPHQLFEQTLQKNFRFLEFDNKRLKIEDYVARIAYRYTQQERLGESSDAQVEAMYVSDETDAQALKPLMTAHCDYLLECSQAKFDQYGRYLTQQDFKILSFIYYSLLDNYKVFSILDYDVFMKDYMEARNIILNDDKYKVLNDTGVDSVERTIAEAYQGYLQVPNNGAKIRQATDWIISEMDIPNVVQIKDAKRTYTYEEKVRKLIEQKGICAISGDKVKYKDCEAAHIVAHSNGGESTYDNFVMCKRKYNRDMGSTNLNDYKKLLVENGEI